MKKALIAGLVLAMAGAGVAAAAPAGHAPSVASLDPSVLKSWIPKDLKWKPSAGLPGAETAVLAGDPTKPGFYVVMNRFQPGAFSTPHYHPNKRYIYVVSGTWWADTGPIFDPEHRTVPFKAGTFVTHEAKGVHYDGSRKGNGVAVVMIFGEGPGSRTLCTGPEAEKGPGPCADAFAKLKK